MCVCVCVCVLRIVSADKVLRFVNTMIVIHSRQGREQIVC